MLGSLKMWAFFPGLLCSDVGFVSVCEAFGCAVLKDAAGMWPKPLAARVGERLRRLLRVGRAVGFDAPT